jgi:hypothetical protein
LKQEQLGFSSEDGREEEGKKLPTGKNVGKESEGCK